jgi:acetyltransferase-like isoleucine patch superfamily enzyme/acyl carrier protein
LRVRGPHQLRKHLAYYVVKHGFDIGEYSGGAEPSISMWGEGSRLKVGKYCMFAEGIRIVLGGNHRTDHVTGFPLGKVMDRAGPLDESYSRGNVTLGSDVWVGKDAMILSGVNVGDGAVVGAGSVVLENVPPYVIVQGNPARPIGKRFPDPIIRRLLKARWWDLDHDQIMELRPLLQSEAVEAVIEACNRIRGVIVDEPVAPAATKAATAPGSNGAQPAKSDAPHATEGAISSWCAGYLAMLLEVSPDKMDLEAPFARLGLDSVGRASFLTALEDTLGAAITPDDMVDYPTIAALARHLAQQDINVAKL